MPDFNKIGLNPPGAVLIDDFGFVGGFGVPHKKHPDAAIGHHGHHAGFICAFAVGAKRRKHLKLRAAAFKLQPRPAFDHVDFFVRLQRNKQVFKGFGGGDGIGHDDVFHIAAINHIGGGANVILIQQVVQLKHLLVSGQICF